jgi:antitoxin HicB
VERKAPVKKAKAKVKAKAKKPNPAIGSGFDDFLVEEGIFSEASTEAAKRVIAWQLQQAMEVQHISKAELARSLHTSRGALDRILDPENTGMTLKSLAAIADFLGKRLEINLVDA